MMCSASYHIYIVLCFYVFTCQRSAAGTKTSHISRDSTFSQYTALYATHQRKSRAGYHSGFPSWGITIIVVVFALAVIAFILYHYRFFCFEHISGRRRRRRTAAENAALYAADNDDAAIQAAFANGTVYNGNNLTGSASAEGGGVYLPVPVRRTRAATHPQELAFDTLYCSQNPADSLMVPVVDERGRYTSLTAGQPLRAEVPEPVASLLPVPLMSGDGSDVLGEAQSQGERRSSTVTNCVAARKCNLANWTFARRNMESGGRREDQEKAETNGECNGGGEDAASLASIEVYGRAEYTLANDDTPAYQAVWLVGTGLSPVESADQYPYACVQIEDANGTTRSVPREPF